MTESKVEVTGFEARHYDLLMNIITFGAYPAFIRNAISKMNIQPTDKIIDLGCGTGRNSCLMAKYLSSEGKIIGLDIGSEMIEQFQQKCRAYPYVEIQNLPIDQPLPFKNEFDKAVMSFVFHGFPDEKKTAIIENVTKALKPGGHLFILDYNEFDIEKKPLIFRRVFKKLECPLALDYIKVDWKSKLKNWGFESFEEHFFLWKIIRLLKAELKK